MPLGLPRAASHERRVVVRTPPSPPTGGTGADGCLEPGPRRSLHTKLSPDRLERDRARPRFDDDGGKTRRISPNLTENPGAATVSSPLRRGGRVVECAGFENRSARKGSGSSNL